MPSVLRALAIVFYVAVVELSNHFSIAKLCETEDCKLTVADYGHLMNPNVNPCQDFFQYACGKSESFLRSQGASNHMKFLLNQYEKSTAELSSPRLDTPIAAGDSDIVKAAKRRFQLCTATSASQKVGQVVQFLNHLATFRTWWELENYIVNKGFESTLFWMERYMDDEIEEFRFFPRASSDKGKSLANDLSSTIRLLLQSRELSSAARQLLNSCPGEDWVAPNEVDDDELSDEAENGVEVFPDVWIAEQDTPSKLTREDWHNYFNNFWSGRSNNVDWVNKFFIALKAPALLSKMGSKWLDNNDSIKTEVVCFTLLQLLKIIDLSGHDDSKCKDMIGKIKIAELDIERKFLPDSLKTSVQALTATVELQTKLQLYHKLPKYNDTNLFMGTPKLDLYNHLVSDAENAALNLNQKIMEDKCCGNCNMDEVKKAAGRVLRFEKRYPRDETSFWKDSSVSDSDEKEKLRTLFENPTPPGMVIGSERNKPVSAQYFNVADSPKTLLDVALENLRMARTLTLDSEQSDNITEAFIMANKPGVKFRKDRPAALNYGGLGAIIAANYPEPSGEDPLHFKDVQGALDIAWGAYLSDKQRGYRDYGRLSSLPSSDDNKLFFLAFANNLCDAQQDTDKINNILKKHEGFKAAYCGTQGQPQQWSGSRPAYRPTPRPYTPED